MSTTASPTTCTDLLDTAMTDGRLDTDPVPDL